MRRSLSHANLMPSTVPYANYTNCTIAQTQSGSIDQRHYDYAAHLTNRILNSKSLTDSEKVKFLKILETL